MVTTTNARVLKVKRNQLWLQKLFKKWLRGEIEEIYIFFYIHKSTVYKYVLDVNGLYAKNTILTIKTYFPLKARLWTGKWFARKHS